MFDFWSVYSGERFRASWPSCLRFLPYMGMAAMLVMWPRPFEQLFFPKGPRGCIWNLVAIRPVVLEEKSFEIVDGRTTEPAYTISSPGAFGLGELNKRAKRPWIAHLSIQAKSQTFNFEIWVTFDQGQRMTLTIDTHSTSLTHWVECFKQLWDLRLQKFKKNK